MWSRVVLDMRGHMYHTQSRHDTSILQKLFRICYMLVFCAVVCCARLGVFVSICNITQWSRDGCIDGLKGRKRIVSMQSMMITGHPKDF